MSVEEAIEILSEIRNELESGDVIICMKKSIEKLLEEAKTRPEALDIAIAHLQKVVDQQKEGR